MIKEESGLACGYIMIFAGFHTRLEITVGFIGITTVTFSSSYWNGSFLT